MSHVLVIEDEKAFAENVKVFLESEKLPLDEGGEKVVFETDIAANCWEAKELLAAKDYDAVLLDLQIPMAEGKPPTIEGGLDLWQDISEKEDRPCVIIVTAYGTLDRAMRTIKAGAYDFLQKPITREELVNTVKKGIEFQRLFREVETLRSSARSYMLQVLTDSMSHTVFDILDNIAGDAEDIAELRRGRLRFQDDKAQQIFDDRIHQIELSVQEMTDAIGRTLRLAKTGQPPIAPCSFNSIIGRALRFLYRNIRIKSIEVEKQLQPLPDLTASQDLLLQLVLNICTNGIEAMEPGGKLSIVTSFLEEENSIRLEVMDTGSGIPQEELRKVFEPLFSMKKSGTGMGLPICQRICIEMDGEIEIQSEQGVGTKVVVTLPVGGKRDHPPSWLAGKGSHLCPKENF